MNRIKQSAYLTVIALVAVLAVGLCVRAYMDTYNVSGGNISIDGSVQPVPGGNGMIGAEGDSNFTNVVTSGNLTVGDEFTQGGSSSTINSFATHVDYGSFADATTTLFSVMNPFPGTSTIDMLEFINTGVSTTSFKLYCGTSTVASSPSSLGGSPFSPALVDKVTIPTSTLQYVVNGTGAGGSINIGAGSLPRIDVGNGIYVGCEATSSTAGVPGDLKGITGGANTFAGTYKIRWYR